MPVQLNHTIVYASDQRRSAEHLARLLGLPEPARFGPFLVVELANGVSLDYMESSERVEPQHYAFLVAEEEFDQIFGRITAEGLEYWADPYGREPGRINTHDGGRGVYWSDPDGHRLEIITRPYGG
jgi:catechol 2,3-dioxygenase-like lactoylglutathione lyase family enzyme